MAWIVFILINSEDSLYAPIRDSPIRSHTDDGKLYSKSLKKNKGLIKKT